jgi:hypothetical protein
VGCDAAGILAYSIKTLFLYTSIGLRCADENIQLPHSANTLTPAAQNP